MRTLIDTLRVAILALAAEPQETHIKVWKFKDAPRELQVISQNGGDEDWIAVVPDAMKYYIPWLSVPSFGCCRVLRYPIAGAIVYIGCHA